MISDVDRYYRNTLRNYRHCEVRQRPEGNGFTLIELMVALVLSAILSATVLQAFIGTRASYRYHNNLVGLQDNARFAIEYLSRSLRMTAYRGNTASEWILGPLVNQLGGVQALTSVDNDNVAANAIKDGTDAITVVYEGNADGYVKDCLGTAIAAGIQVSNMFSISTQNELQCSTDNGATYTPIINDVESMQLLYGLDATNDQVANKYVTANNVTDTDNVVSVRVGLLLNSREDNLTQQRDAKTYVVLDQTVYGPGAYANDFKFRRNINLTVKFRNRL